MEGLKLPPPENMTDADRDIAKLFDGEEETARQASFGPTYFRGVFWGSLTSGILLAFSTRGSFRNCQATRSQLKKQGRPDAFSDLWIANPTSLVMTCLCGSITVLKMAKTLAARARYNEFLWEEYWEENLASDEDRAEIAALKAQRDLALEREQEQLDDVFNQFRTGRKQDQLPTFWDGASVGVIGSLQDSWNPVKPLDKYLNKRGGKSW